MTSKIDKKAPKSLKLAEREGFEPSVRVTPYDSLANCWFQPLTHRSIRRICHTDSAGVSIQFLPWGQQVKEHLRGLSVRQKALIVALTGGLLSLRLFSHCDQAAVLQKRNGL